MRLQKANPKEEVAAPIHHSGFDPRQRCDGVGGDIPVGERLISGVERLPAQHIRVHGAGGVASLGCHLRRPSTDPKTKYQKLSETVIIVELSRVSETVRDKYQK